MELEDLDLLRRVARTGSISAAARELGLTQPTASRRLRRLERALGAELLRRSGPAVSPTRAGLAVLRLAPAMLALAEELRAELSRPADLQGTLAVAASTAPGESFVPELLARFAARHPHLAVHLHVFDSAAVERCVAEGACDVGFLGQPPQPGVLEALIVGHDELVLAVPRGHPYFGARELPRREILRQAFVERSPGSATRRTVEERMAAAGIAYGTRRIVFEASSPQAVLAAVRSGLGVGFVSRSALAQGAGEEVQGLGVEGVDLSRPIYFVHRPDRARPAARAFRAFVAEAARQAGE